MRRSIIAALLFPALLSIGGMHCKNSTAAAVDDPNSIFQKAIHTVNPAEDTKRYKAYLVIPNTGCDGCINDAENLLKVSINTTEPVRFVLTNIVSMKMLRLKLGIDVEKSDRVLLDTANIFSKGSLRSIYPRSYLINADGRLIKEVDVSPGQDGLGELGDHVRK